MFATLAVLLIQPDVRLRQVDAFIPMVNSIIMMGDLITATLLYVQAAVFRSRALTALASGYVFAALLVVAHALSFPGAFAPDGLLGGGISTTAWIAYFWRATIPVSVILYVLLRSVDSNSEFRARRAGLMISAGLSAAIAGAGAVVLLTTLGHDFLPSVFLTPTELNFTNIWMINWVLLALLSVATTMLYRERKSVLDMWLLVASATWIAHAFLNLEVWGRFTVGFYSQFILLLFSHLILMLALIAENSRLYARLALSTAARRREREARLMSMDAVTAAIAHEVGQPLTAVSLNASAGLSWLIRSRPNVDKAIDSLRAISDGGKRTFEIIKSIRATFAKEPGRGNEFNVNDLVLETVALLDRERAAHKVSVELALDETLPPIFADKVQIQRVLVNLFNNAMESLDAIGNRPRTITVRSSLVRNQDVTVEVEDSGQGIASEDIEHVFDAFFTTKATGTGLGLSLCRTIVEEHGGRLWATPGKPHGATFHLHLPRAGVRDDSMEATDQLLANLEVSLRSFPQSELRDSKQLAAELQQVIDQVRTALTRTKP